MFILYHMIKEILNGNELHEVIKEPLHKKEEKCNILAQNRLVTIKYIAGNITHFVLRR